MNIAFLTYGTSPVPATKGGAVENLIEDLLDENEKSHSLDITVFSIYEDAAAQKANEYKYTNFNFVKCSKIVDCGDRLIYSIAKNIFKKENLISYRFILRRLYVMAHYPKLLLKQDYDRVVLVTNSTLFFVLKNKKVFNKYQGKVVYYLHNEVRSLFRCQKEAASIRGLIGISEFVNKAFRKQIPDISQGNCYVLKNCIDTNAFGISNIEKELEFKKRFNISKDDFVVIFAGRIVKEKGALEVVQAIKNCKRSNIKLLIVGGGFYSSDVIDNYSLKLRNEAADIADRIIFTGYIEYSDMPSIYAISDVAVLPSLWDEPAGMTMVEAVISGTPLITTNSGGIPEYIPQNAAIILDRDESLVSNISNTICTLMDDGSLRKRLTKEGRKLREELNLKNYYSNFVEIIKK
jgi:spore coat protein SA